ncbi:MAG: hypothetical protein Kow00107_00830 [Planctomycetota bacterium]
MHDQALGLLNTASESLAAKDIQGCLEKMAVLYHVRREAAPVFLGDNFEAIFKGIERDMEALSPGLPRMAEDIAIRFSMIRSRLLCEEYHSDKLLAAENERTPQFLYLSRAVVGLTFLAEDSRIAGLRLLHLSNSPAAGVTARLWLKESNTALRLAAVNLIGRTGSQEDEKAFDKLSRNDSEPMEIRVECALASARLGGTGAQLLRQTLLSYSAQAAIRLRCVEALSVLGRESAEPAFVSLLNSEDIDIRILSAAMRWMAQWGTPELGAHLPRFLASRDPDLKRSAIVAAGKMKAIRLLPDICAILENADSAALKIACIAAIADCDAEALAEKVSEYLYDASFPVRLEAALAIQAFSGKDFGLTRGVSPSEQQKIIHKIRVWWQERNKQ